MTGILSGSARNYVVRALAEAHPLSAKQIFLHAKRNAEKPWSYQGVHKALALLEKEGVVVRGKDGYALDSAWLSENKAFFDSAEKRYCGKHKLSLQDVAENCSATVEFDSFLEAGLWFLDEMEKDYTANPKPDLGVIAWRHPWPLSTLPEKDFLRLKKLMERDVHYALCASKNPLDEILMDFWKNVGKKPKLGVAVAVECDELAIHDYYLQYFLPDKTKRQMDELFKKAKTADGKTLAKYYQILYEKKEKTKVVVVHNAQVANRFRESALKFYK